MHVQMRIRGRQLAAFGLAAATAAAGILPASAAEPIGDGVAPTYDEALWRARNIAAPKNAQRMGKKTPCAVKGDRCYDCRSPERICRSLVVLWGPSMSLDTEIVLVDEDLGL